MHVRNGTLVARNKAHRCLGIEWKSPGVLLLHGSADTVTIRSVAFIRTEALVRRPVVVRGLSRFIVGRGVDNFILRHVRICLGLKKN